MENEEERDFWSQPSLNQAENSEIATGMQGPILVREMTENSETTIGMQGPIRIREMTENSEEGVGPVQVREEVDAVWTEINEGDSEEVIQEDQEPQIQESPEDIPEVSTSHSRYILPPRQIVERLLKGMPLKMEPVKKLNTQLQITLPLKDYQNH